MNKLLIGLTAAVALATPALAADLPVKAPPLPPPPVFTWTGCYIGGHAGGEWTHTNGFTSTPATAFGGPGVGLPFNVGQVYVNTNSSAFIVGAQDGCNYQINPWLVVGVEADLDLIPDSHAPSGAVTAAAVGGGLSAASVAGSSPDFMSTIRGRIGVTGWNNRVLAYVTGGGAYMNINSLQHFPPAPGFDTQQFDNVWGWTVGGGLEYAISNNLIARAEYLFVQMPRYTTFTGPIPGGALGFPGPLTTQLNTSVARFGLSYKFTDKLFFWM